MPLVQHATNGGGGGASDGPRLSPQADAPVGALGAQAAALLHVARWSGAQHDAAHLLAGHRANSADPQPRGANGGQGTLDIGAVAFIHCFGSSLNEHVHFHVCVVDGVFEEVELFHWTTLEQPLVADCFQPNAEIAINWLVAKHFY